MGDQLAAINGASALKMKVDDICALIAKSNKPQSVKLVFLRYVGPFIPLRKTIPQELSFEMEALGSPHSSFEEPPPSSTATPPQVAKKGGETKKKGFRLFGRGKKKVGES